jgi:dTDP-4-amino-4,6-dideoxygalactose transaminase
LKLVTQLLKQMVALDDIAALGPGQEVTVPDVTWIATSAPVDYVGAEPLLRLTHIHGLDHSATWVHSAFTIPRAAKAACL